MQIQLAPTMVTSRSYRFRRDCQYPRGVNAISFMSTSMINNKFRAVLIRDKWNVYGFSSFHCEIVQNKTKIATHFLILKLEKNSLRLKY